MKKRILSLVLVLAMLASMCMFVSADDANPDYAPVVAATTAAGNAGDTVTVDVLAGGMMIDCWHIAFNFDTTRLEWVSSEVNEELWPDATAGVGDAINFLSYDSNFFGCQDGYGAIDATEEAALLFTVTFKIKEDALPGDAYINFNGDKAKFSLRDSSSGTAYKYERTATYQSGKVTVLKDGYTAIPTCNESEWNIEFDGEIDEYYVDKYKGKGGDVVLPASASNVYGSSTFAGVEDAITSITVPASYIYFADSCFFGLKNCKKIVFLGDALDSDFIGTKAFGWYKNGRNDKVVDGLVVYGIAGSYIEQYCDDNGIPFVEYKAPDMVTVDVAGVETVFEVEVDEGGQIALPGATLSGDKICIGWKANDTLVSGKTVDYVPGMVLAPVAIIDAPVGGETASVRMADTAENTGLRFTSDFAKADYEALVAGFGAENVKVTILITPENYYKAAGAFTKAALDKLAADYELDAGYVEVENSGAFKDDGTKLTFAGSLKNFKDATLAANPKFVSVACITAGGECYYGSVAAPQTIADTLAAVVDNSEALLASGELTQDQLDAVLTLQAKLAD